MRDGPCGSPRVWLAIEPGYDPTRGFNNKLVIDRTNTRTYISSLEYSPHFSLHPLFMDLLSIAVIRKSHLVILIHPVRNSCAIDFLQPRDEERSLYYHDVDHPPSEVVHCQRPHRHPGEVGLIPRTGSLDNPVQSFQGPFVVHLHQAIESGSCNGTVGWQK